MSRMRGLANSTITRAWSQPIRPGRERGGHVGKVTAQLRRHRHPTLGHPRRQVRLTGQPAAGLQAEVAVAGPERVERTQHHRFFGVEQGALPLDLDRPGDELGLGHDGRIGDQSPPSERPDPSSNMCTMLADSVPGNNR